MSIDELQMLDTTRYQVMQEVKVDLAAVYKRYLARTTHERRDELIKDIETYSIVYED